MLQQYTNPKLGSILALTDDLRLHRNELTIQRGLVEVLWNKSNENVQLLIDDIPVTLAPNQMVTVTFFQHLSFQKGTPPLTAFVFNREFYCLVEYDSEVGCNGILFFGTQDIPVISLPEDEIRKFEDLFDVFIEEFGNRDNIQGDMLQMLLKRLIIKCTRLAKTQRIVKSLDNQQIEVIRNFNFMVDVNFKTHKQVHEYAEMLHKSPKTLSNLFAIYNQKSPLQIIHERIILETKRMIYFTDKNVKEIAYELGFDDPTSLSKLFKKVTGETITEFKDKNPLPL